jgi:hypothetical protein
MVKRDYTWRLKEEGISERWNYFARKGRMFWPFATLVTHPFTLLLRLNGMECWSIGLWRRTDPFGVREVRGTDGYLIFSEETMEGALKKARS